VPCSPPISLFRRLLGASFDQLPDPIRRVHDDRPHSVLAGRCHITRGAGLPVRLLGWAASLPQSGNDLPLTVSFVRDGAREVWSRDFGGHPMRSTLTERNGLLEEVLGPARFSFALRVDDGQVAWSVVAIRVLGLPLPAAWFRAVTARQSVQAGRYTFDVRAELPWIGLLVHYHGWLEAG
jgi:hypothetical protein